MKYHCFSIVIFRESILGGGGEMKVNRVLMVSGIVSKLYG